MNTRRFILLVVVISIFVSIGIVRCEEEGQSGGFWNKRVTEKVLKKDYPVQPVAFTQVKLDDVFWTPRIETNRKVTIPYAFGKCEETGRINNFAIAGGLKEGEHKGEFPFDDTDPYKILEGASYCLSVAPDPNLDKYLDNLIALISAAQEDDGYLYTCRTNKSERLKNWYGNARWEKLDGSHELYNMGHLYEAAVAHWQATGKRTLLDVVTKNADFLCEQFGPGKVEKWPGHQIIEMGLARLYRATGEQKYLDLAKYLLDVRGPGGNPYNQSHQKVVDQNEAVGHAVRATYMYCGMADVAALTGDVSYQKAIDRIWENVVGKKLYLTGGIGATGSGEAFGRNYQLPNETAYCETCAAIGNVMWNHRMFLEHGDAKYIDVLERTLYNGLISGVSLDGKLFFYPNPLASHGQHSRSPWFGCACCPGNVTRFVASVPGYVYAQAGKDLYVNLYTAGTGRVDMPRGNVQIEQTTQYPWDGYVRMVVNPEKAMNFAICVRIPGWAQGRPVPSDLYRYADDMAGEVSIKVNGKTVALDIDKGYQRLARKWRKGDVIELQLPMAVRRVLASEQVADDRGRVALERGPIVYCAEWPDNEGNVHNLVLTDDVELRTKFEGDLLGGVTVVRGKAASVSYSEDGEQTIAKACELTAIPYYAWAHRGRGAMAVWLAREKSAAEVVTPLGVVPNGSFEKSVGDSPVGWKSQTYSGRARFRYVEGGRTGQRCVMITSGNGADAGWLGTVTVKPNTQYRLSAWIKTEDLDAGTGKGALLNIHNIQPLQTPAVSGTTDWTKVEISFNSGDNAFIQINCLFGGWGLANGTAWYDDLKIEPVSADTSKNYHPTMYYGDDTYGRPWAKDPDVVRLGDKYLMYYSINRGAKGIAVGIAESRDIDNWKKVGELLPGAEYEKKGLAAPAAMVRGGRVHLFYQTYGNGRNDAICHAFSEDGIHFERNASNPVFRPTGDWNCGRAIDADVIAYNTQLLLYCATRDPKMKVQQLVVAAAPVDSDWGRDKWKQLCDKPILKPELVWEKDCIEAPSVFEHNGRLYMFYAGAYNNAPQQIGCAVSDDGVVWKRLSDLPLVPNGEEGEWNSSESGHPGVFVDNDGRMHLFFQGNNDNGRTWHLSRMEIGWEQGEPYLIRPQDSRQFRVRQAG